MTLKRKTPLKAKTGLKTRKPLARGKPPQANSRPMKRSKIRPASRPKRTKIRDSARGEPCQVRVAGVCNGDNSTTVLAHRNGAGMACKASDHDAAYACSACHEWLDGGYVRYGYTRLDRDAVHDKGIVRTREILKRKGLASQEGTTA